MRTKNDIILYYYSGSDYPKWFDVTSLVLIDEYGEDITQSFIRAYNDMIERYTIKEMIEVQPLMEYHVFMNPTKRYLELYNLHLGLDPTDNIQEYEQVI